MDDAGKEPPLETTSTSRATAANAVLAEEPSRPSTTSLEACLEREARAVGRLCMALLGRKDEADDAVQETLLAAHASFDAYAGSGTLRAWLFGIARRQCARQMSRGAARAKLTEALPEPEPPTGQQELLELKQRALEARALLAQVRPSEREALVLRYVAELSFREVADACGIDEATARKRVSRALSRLRDLTRVENEA